jgi:hypothetical protein
MTSSLAAPASADVDVVPDPYAPSVTVGAIEKNRPQSEVETRDRPAQIRAEFECDQGPGARAAGLNCRITAFPGTWSPPPTEGDLGDIERAIREIPMPPLKLHIQPDSRTLVNVDTIFYTDPTRLRRTVTLLGHSVRLDATPVRFTWVHGDGTTATTGNPGRPYPAKDVTHQYQQPGDGLRARVDTAYRVRYSVDGGGWATLDETLTAPGPTTALDVDEAAPVLTR